MKNNDDQKPVNAENLLQLIEEGNLNATMIERTSISIDFVNHMKRTGWKLIRVDSVGDKLKCYFARE